MPSSNIAINLDFDRFEFQGFGSPGHCFLRTRGTLRSDGKGLDLIFLCVQLRNYYGTSVTNAIEDIFFRAIDELPKSVGDPAIKRLIPKRGRPLAEARRHIRWVEHYPPGVGIDPSGSYALVAFDAAFNPTWNYVTLQRAASECGVAQDFFKVRCSLLNYGKQAL